MAEKQGHSFGALESVKFDHRRKDYYDYVDFLKKKNVPLDECLQDFTAYVGHMSLHRMITIYELYKQTLGLAGHIADVGVYKGASSLLFAKLIKIFESESLTLCHGFDWFEGMQLNEKDSALIENGGYKTEYEDILELVNKQGFSNILKIHKLDLKKDLNEFFDENQHLRFKLVMMDAGTYDVMKASIPFFYERLIPGGIMIFDQYSHEFAPGESNALHELLPNVSVKTLVNSWMPNAYIVKS
ncbi:class I SAM-dependent methyltransferase [Thalassotalea sediminis]|uniref:class I SAM-dependent methyltransferase n=1 Tax=Thalassotalea sediminis TaxID=1759089 RepID=UPI002572E66B|nr:class I SAM-dependent methyltransferase [Thalassotalea sediminis]